MKRLLQFAQTKFDEAEVFFCQSAKCKLSIENGNLKNLGGEINSGYAIRGIKRNILGTSFLNNLSNREGAAKGAALSMAGKVEAKFSFPASAKIKNRESYDKTVESMTFSDLSDLGQEINCFFDGKVKGQMNQYMGFNRGEKRIINSNGLDLRSRDSLVYAAIHLVYPKTSNGLFRGFYTQGPRKVPRKALNEILDTYDASIPVVSIETGSYPVLFMPDALFPILWRLYEGANGRNILKKSSPLTGKKGEQVFSESFSMSNNPLDFSRPGAAPFDDEGVPTRKLDIIKDGVFKTCFVNLDYASKLKMKPTGTGFRSEFFMPGNPIRTQPAPLLKHMSVLPGKDRFSDMVGSMSKGIIIHDALGPHSGNILNGDFSVGLAPGFLVRKGEIVGRVKSGLISGNIYDILRKVEGIEDRIHYPDEGNENPSILFDGIKVSAK